MNTEAGEDKNWHRGSPRHTWLGHHFQGQKVKGQGHQATLVGVVLAGQHGHTVMVTYCVHDVYRVTTWRPGGGDISWRPPAYSLLNADLCQSRRSIFSESRHLLTIIILPRRNLSIPRAIALLVDCCCGCNHPYTAWQVQEGPLMEFRPGSSTALDIILSRRSALLSMYLASLTTTHTHIRTRYNIIIYFIYIFILCYNNASAPIGRRH